PTVAIHFPYTTLFRSICQKHTKTRGEMALAFSPLVVTYYMRCYQLNRNCSSMRRFAAVLTGPPPPPPPKPPKPPAMLVDCPKRKDRKSTRLNSSHEWI